MAAKKIQISNDAEITWDDLPGSEGSFSVEAEAVDDTILGQTYSSTDVGLDTWSVSSNGIFKGFSGYLAELKLAGTPTVSDGESFTQVAGQVYKIDDAAKEIWDRSDTVVVYDNAIDHTADVESIDYLFGQITFAAGYSVTEPVTADISHFATIVALGKANAYTLTMTADAIDETDFVIAQGNSGTRIFKPGLRTVNCELTGIFDPAESYKSDVTGRTELIIEIDPAGDGSSIARGFFKALTTAQSGAVGALEEETVNFALTVPDETAGPKITLPFQWRHTATTLNQAIQSALVSFLTELNTYDVRYMPNGAIGESPLDAIKGNFIITDMSLSGGLSNMNVFVIEMTGTGEFTVV